MVEIVDHDPKRKLVWGTTAGLTLVALALVMWVVTYPSPQTSATEPMVAVPPVPASLDEKRVYTYQIYSNDPAGGTASTITYGVDDAGTVGQLLDAKLPVEKAVTFPPGEFKMPTVSAVADKKTSGILCRILSADGRELDAQASVGTRTAVTCSAQE